MLGSWEEGALGMVANSDKAKGRDDDLAAQLTFAVRAIRADSNLRALVRHFLSICRAMPPASVFDIDPRQNAYNQGYQAAGLELAALLTAEDPALVPSLLLEELDPNDDE